MGEGYFVAFNPDAKSGTDGYVFASGQIADPGVKTIEMWSDGSATFANNVSADRFYAYPPTAGGNAIVSHNAAGDAQHYCYESVS